MSADDSGIAGSLRPFRARPWPVHVAVLLVGVGLWVGTYLLAVHVTPSGRLVGADSPAGVLARQRVAILAGLVTGAYFAVAFTRGLGGPLWNLFAPALVPPFVPTTVYTDFGGVPAQVLRPASLGATAATAQYVAVTAVPLVLTFGTALGWSVYLDRRGTYEQWAAVHLPTRLRPEGQS